MPELFRRLKDSVKNSKQREREGEKEGGKIFVVAKKKPCPPNIRTRWESWFGNRWRMRGLELIMWPQGQWCRIQTHTNTHTHTHIWTWQLYDWIGPVQPIQWTQVDFAREWSHHRQVCYQRGLPRTYFYYYSDLSKASIHELMVGLLNGLRVLQKIKLNIVYHYKRWNTEI